MEDSDVGANAGTNVTESDQGGIDWVVLLADIALAGGVRVAVAESLTSGLVASAIGAGPEAEDWFAGGVVAYQSSVKEGLLGVEPGLDPVSGECAEQLAVGVLRAVKADVAVSTTGVGGPDPQDGHPPGTVYIGWAMDGSHGHRALRLNGDPEHILSQTVTAAVRLLLDASVKL